jgi:microcystin-dependent protein
MTQAINLANFSNSLDSSGGVPPTQLNAVVPLSKGGTNAATAADARTNLSVYSTTETTTAIAVANPPGEIKMWATGTAPTGYLLCAGAAVSRTTYATLFAVIGITFGSGDGATTFNLPDFRDRMPIGAGTTYALNASGGSADAVVVNHTHTTTVTDPGHQHFIAGSGTSNNTALTSSNYMTASGNQGGGIYGYSLCGEAPVASVGLTNSKTTGISVANTATGSSATNANLPPYRGIYFIIKT